jgi:SAM-dependent methyltransferase
MSWREGHVSWEYGTLASEVYDLDKPVGRSFADVAYYTGLLAAVSGPILEPAAGTGRILIPLLEAGHEVEGLDSSPEMLALCRQHCRDRGLDPVLREADMTIYVRLAAYEAVIIPAGSIALLDGRKATLQALTCFRDCLVPGGLLVVDVLVPQPAAGNETMRYWRRGSCLWTLQTLHTEYNPVTSQTTRFLRYDKWQDGTLRTTELQTFRLQHWSSREFEELLAEAGFSDIAVTGDYQDACALGPGNEVWTFHTTRAAAPAPGIAPGDRPGHVLRTVPAHECGRGAARRDDLPGPAGRRWPHHERPAHGGLLFDVGYRPAGRRQMRPSIEHAPHPNNNGSICQHTDPPWAWTYTGRGRRKGAHLRPPVHDPAATGPPIRAGTWTPAGR